MFVVSSKLVGEKENWMEEMRDRVCAVGDSMETERSFGEIVHLMIIARQVLMMEGYK